MEKKVEGLINLFALPPYTNTHTHTHTQYIYIDTRKACKTHFLYTPNTHYHIVFTHYMHAYTPHVYTHFTILASAPPSFLHSGNLPSTPPSTACHYKNTNCINVVV